VNNVRNDGAYCRRLDLLRISSILTQYGAQEDSELIGGGTAIRSSAKRNLQFFAGIYSAQDLGVANIKTEKHAH
jgi:hypothetical protein